MRNPRLNKIVLLLSVLTLALLALPVSAQQGEGQICVRSFEDRNQNGVKDASEPFLTDGVVANLLNAEGVIIATSRLAESQRRSEGLVCFSRLAPGQYTVNVISADYVPTTASQYTTQVTETSIPQVFEFGTELLVIEAATPERTAPQDLSEVLTPDRLQRLLVAAGGAAVVILFMLILGVLVWFLILRPRRQETPITGNLPSYAPYRPPTGQIPVAPVASPPVTPSTGRFEPITPPGGTPPVPDEPRRDT